MNLFKNSALHVEEPQRWYVRICSGSAKINHVEQQLEQLGLDRTFHMHSFEVSL